jgi:hypothetical protein
MALASWSGVAFEQDPQRAALALFDDQTSRAPRSRGRSARVDAAPKTAERVAGGWSYVLSRLKTLLETGEPLASH